MAISVDTRVALISGIFGILAAALSAIISMVVADNRVESEREKLRLEDRVARANLFKKLIEDLENEKTANYALLALWQVYSEKKDRKIILAAALQKPDSKTLQMLKSLGFQDELKTYLDEIEALLKPGANGSEAARELLMDIDPKRYLKFLLKDLQHGENADILDDRIQQVKLILKRDAKLEKVVSENLDKDRPSYTTIALALYDAGKKRCCVNTSSRSKRTRLVNSTWPPQLSLGAARNLINRTGFCSQRLPRK